LGVSNGELCCLGGACIECGRIGLLGCEEKYLSVYCVVC
jgi:hypothetical protein